MFLRGFLLRFIDSEDWRTHPVGQYSSKAWIAVCVYAAVTHPELIAAKEQEIPVFRRAEFLGHLLMGYSCETLGVYPFTPVNIGTITDSFGEMFRQQQENDGENALKSDAEIILLPGISTYVGADISSGMLVCDFDKLEKEIFSN